MKRMLGAFYSHPLHPYATYRLTARLLRGPGTTCPPYLLQLSTQRSQLQNTNEQCSVDPSVARNTPRLIIMRSDSELLIFIFRSEKRMGLLTQSDFAKTDGTKSDLRIRWPKSSDFKIRRLDPSDSQIEKWERSLSK